jgi:hypothetical protein
MTTPTNDSVDRDPRDEIDAIETRLRDELRPEQYALHERVETLRNEQELALIGRLIDAVAAHFPGLAPAILAVHAHAWETGDLWSCGLEVDKATWPGFDNCADATRPPKLRS